MRLDDLWDPDQGWALLSDTASKHSRTDPVVFLYQNYFRPARLLAIHVDESARTQQQEVLEYRFRGRDKPSDVVTCERTDVELACAYPQPLFCVTDSTSWVCRIPKSMP